MPLGDRRGRSMPQPCRRTSRGAVHRPDDRPGELCVDRSGDVGTGSDRDDLPLLLADQPAMILDFSSFGSTKSKITTGVARSRTRRPRPSPPRACGSRSASWTWPARRPGPRIADGPSMMKRLHSRSVTVTCSMRPASVNSLTVVREAACSSVNPRRVLRRKNRCRSSAWTRSAPLATGRAVFP